MKTWQKILTLIFIFILGTSGSCLSRGRNMCLVVTFDVEDYISPGSEGIDDIPKWLAEIMTEEGVTGTFFVIGEKARSLEMRGRLDVIAAMAGHDIGRHTTHGSIHPTVTEQLEKTDWDRGVSQMAEQESAGIEELERIFGVPVTTLARHGGSYGPQLIHALGRIKTGYVGSPVNLPGKNVVWFCNALNFFGQYDGFDNAYYRDDLFEPLMEKIERELPKLSKTAEAISLFAGHPCKIRTKQFWDFNYYHGENPDAEQWKTPEMRPLESMRTAQKNFRRLMQFLKSQSGIEITTFRVLMERFGHQKEILSKVELCRIADYTVKEQNYFPSEFFSPAEAFAGLVQSILDFKTHGTLPRSMELSSRPLGPRAMPDPNPEISRVTLLEVYELAEKALAHIEEFFALPAKLEIKDFRIGTGSLFALFSAVYLDMDSNHISSGYDVPPFDPYPRTNEKEIIPRIESYRTWPVHRRDLDMTQIIENTKLQLWTLKPAHSR